MDTQPELATALLQPVTLEQVSAAMSEQQQQQPVKVRKKPGRKPNPASPALRKAQNRAAQRAFRERKERHLRELEAAVKQMREQRDRLQAENEELRRDQDILRSENWYLKGIVLTLQLVCFRHNLVIPQHSPYINEEALSVLAQSIPEPIASYLSANANNKLPIPSSLLSPMTMSSATREEEVPRKPRDRYLSSGSIVVTRDGVRSEPLLEELVQPRMPSLSPPTELAVEPLTSNLAAIQALRMRLRLQSACAKMDAASFAIQPTILQLTIPHDPRIDLIPTPTMRDRMILFRDLFDLDECFQCLIGNSVFHGGDPAVAANWQLPPEFFDKFWFLTIDFSLQRTTNRWRRMQGLSEIKENNSQGNTTSASMEIPELVASSSPEPLHLRDYSSSSSSSSSTNSNNDNDLFAHWMKPPSSPTPACRFEDMCPPWDDALLNSPDVDAMMESLIDTEQTL